LENRREESRQQNVSGITGAGRKEHTEQNLDPAPTAGAELTGRRRILLRADRKSNAMDETRNVMKNKRKRMTKTSSPAPIAAYISLEPLAAQFIALLACNLIESQFIFRLSFFLSCCSQAGKTISLSLRLLFVHQSTARKAPIMPAALSRRPRLLFAAHPAGCLSCWQKCPKLSQLLN